MKYRLPSGSGERYGEHSADRLRPFTAASNDHFTRRAREVCRDAIAVEGLSSATVRRWEVAIRSFLRHMDERTSDTFFAGDMRVQAKAIEYWVAALRTEGRERTTITAYFDAALAL